MTSYPTPTLAERHAWRVKKEDDRARARVRNRLPKGIAKLELLLADAKSPWYAEVIQARIDQVREQDRLKRQRRRARDRNLREQAEADNDARLTR